MFKASVIVLMTLGMWSGQAFANDDVGPRWGWGQGTPPRSANNRATDRSSEFRRCPRGGRPLQTLRRKVGEGEGFSMRAAV